MSSFNNYIRLFNCFLFLINIVNGFELLVMHTNDMHGRFEETSRSTGTCKPENRNRACYGGFARVGHVVREARRKAKAGLTPPVIFLNAGDTFTGTAWFSIHRSTIAADFLNRIQPDVISFGNHEFDYGIEGLAPFIEHLKVPIVAANMDFSDEPEMTRPIKKSHILNINEMRIGVIGYLLPDTSVIANTGRVKFINEVEAIRKESERLKVEENCKIIIALGHSGIEMDKQIAANVPLVDLVVGGHTNTFLWNGKEPDIEVPEGPYPILVKQKSGKEVPVVQTYAYTKYIGVLNLTFNDDGDLLKAEGQPILLDSSIPQDEDLLEALEPYRDALKAQLYEKVGMSKVVLNLANCRTYECNVGNLLADAMVEYIALNYVGNYWTDSPAAITNAGSIRSSIDKGEVTYGDLLGALPFNVRLISFAINGSDLIKTFENGVRSNGETSRGEFLQVSGFHVLYDLSQPVGNRVVRIKIRCGQCDTPIYEDLIPSKEYRIISNSFILNGGDAYDILKYAARDLHREDITDIDVLSWYMKRKITIMPDEEERIKFINNLVSAGGRVYYDNAFISLMLLILFILQLY